MLKSAPVNLHKQWTLHSTCTCVLLTLFTHSHVESWEHAMVQYCSAFIQSLCDFCVSLFSMEMKVSRSNKIYFWSLQFTRCPFWVHFLCFNVYSTSTYLHVGVERNFMSGKAIFLCCVHSGAPSGAWGRGWLCPPPCSFVHLPLCNDCSPVCTADCLSPLSWGRAELCSVR